MRVLSREFRHWLVKHIYNFSAVSVWHLLWSHYLSSEVILILILSVDYWGVISLSKLRNDLLMVGK